MTNQPQARPGPWLRGLLAMLAAGALSACGGASEDTTASTTKTAAKSARLSSAMSDEGDTSTSRSGAEDDLSVALQKSSSSRTMVQPPNTEGRLLASNCFQCHGTLGRGGFDSIRGGEAEEIDEFLTKAANKDIMAAHAQGYTPAQIQKIVAYLQQ